jgi:hypothetical protein
MFTLETGSGFWNPLVWIASFIIAFLIIYIIRSFGNKTYKKDTTQTTVFLSGNPEYTSDAMHVKSSNLYWGFTTTLNWIYTVFKRMHTGNVSDYILWFIIILAIFMIMGVLL